MGYYSRLTGSIKINPPLTAAELREHSWLTKPEPLTVFVSVVKKRVDTDTGYTVTLAGSEIVPTTEDELNVNHLQTELEGIAAIPGHSFDGYIYAYGEEQGDIWRITIRDGQVVEEKPKVVWPDGTEHEVGR